MGGWVGALAAGVRGWVGAVCGWVRCAGGRLGGWLPGEGRAGEVCTCAPASPAPWPSLHALTPPSPPCPRHPHPHHPIRPTIDQIWGDPWMRSGLVRKSMAVPPAKGGGQAGAGAQQLDILSPNVDEPERIRRAYAQRTVRVSEREGREEGGQGVARVPARRDCWPRSAAAFTPPLPATSAPSSSAQPRAAVAAAPVPRRPRRSTRRRCLPAPRPA